VERIYEFGPLFITNPLNRFWALLDEGNICKGILWITIDPIVEIIAVNILSVDREYQQLNGSLRSKPSEIIRKIADFLHKFQDELIENGGAELKREILWATTRPKTCERAGAKRHSRIIMEIK